jgi:hypothetical protein
MGWRAADRRDRDERARLRRLPLAARCDWRTILMLLAACAAGSVIGLLLR